ncbi:cold-shock protein [Paenibacillus beijingensis]|uniref:cold-shock protein n=1 Tax=Paenibacillus beijingensis TaxID=1126833 RepID=UPI0009E5D9DF|nr:cold-shock protein [Paenibacillus beijingensis]
MYTSRKKPEEDIPEEITVIWSCANPQCKCWMRDNFSLSVQPSCPQCQSAMVKGEKKLTVLSNTSYSHTKV